MDHHEDENNIGTVTSTNACDDSFMPGGHRQRVYNVEMVINETTPSLPILTESLQDIQTEPGDMLLTPPLNLQQHASPWADEGEDLEDTEESTDIE